MLQHSLNRFAHNNQALLSTPADNKTSSAQSLCKSALNFVHHLKKITPLKQPLACLLPNSAELLCLQLACFHLGLTIIPIIYDMDPDTIHKILSLTSPSHLFTNSEKHAALISTSTPIPCVVEILDGTFLTNSSSEPHLNQPLPTSTALDQDVAMIIFSSGTSGQLKGIMHSYASAYGFLEGLVDILAVEKNLTYLVAQPMGHIGGIITTLMTLLYNGHAILLKQFEISAYMQAMEKYQPTHINLHTPLYYEIINYPYLKRSAFKNIKTSFAGGDDIPDELPTIFSDLTGAPMQIGYGMTETGIVMLNRHPYGIQKGSCGSKTANSEIEIRDEKNKIVPTGAPGDIWIRSPACCLGYWKMPELNQATIVNGWFKTGDIAAIDASGMYWFKNRASQIIKRGKDLIFPNTIEQVFFRHPLIKSAAVIPLTDMQEGQVPVVFIELKTKPTPKEITQDLFKFASQHLQPFEVPTKIIILDKMPLNLTGKIDRSQLR